MSISEITPHQLSAMQDAEADSLQIIDVREQWEFDIGHIHGSILIPLSELENKAGQIDPTVKTVVICHHGIRSMMACHYLAQNGCQSLFNLSGGIDAWSKEIDSSIEQY